jgi:PPOX class probable F420-dependent enzyme
MSDRTPVWSSSGPPLLGEPARALLRAHRLGVLATLRQDGTAHLSTIAYGFDEATEVLRVSLTEDRVKVRHLRRDLRASMHVGTADQSSWVAVTCTAELTVVTGRPGDPVGQELAELYEQIAGRPHPDPAEFADAMVEERRLVLRLRPRRVTSGGAG